MRGAPARGQQPADTQRGSTTHPPPDHSRLFIGPVMSVCAVALIGATTDDGIIRGKALFLTNDEGMLVICAGAVEDGNGALLVKSKTGEKLIYAGSGSEGDGFTGAGAVGLFRLHAGGQTHRKPTQLAMSKWSDRLTWNGASALSDQIVLV